MMRTQDEKRRARREAEERRRRVVVDESPVEAQRGMVFGDTITRLIEQFPMGRLHGR